jgi:hypothetical protein
MVVAPPLANAFKDVEFKGDASVSSTQSDPSPAPSQSFIIVP